MRNRKQTSQKNCTWYKGIRVQWVHKDGLDLFINTRHRQCREFDELLYCGSVAEWLACWTQAQKGPGSNCSRDAVV